MSNVKTIKCGNCKLEHNTVEEVRTCSATQVARVEVTPEEIAALLAEVPVVTRKERKLTWDSKEVNVILTSVERKVNPESGSIRLEMRLAIKDTNLTVFQNLSLKGGTLDSIDRMVCKFSGKLMTDSAVGECTIGHYVDAVEAMIDSEFNAWVFQDGDGFLRAPLTLSAGRPGWKPFRLIATEAEVAVVEDEVAIAS